MNAPRIRAVIFDMDGVLLDSEAPATAAWKRAVADLGYCLTDEINNQLIGRNAVDSDAILRATLGRDFPIDAARRSAAAHFAALTAAHGIPMKPGVDALLDFLDAEKLPCAVATSTERDACERAMTRCHLLHRFAVIVCGDEIKTGKPAPDIFEETARRLQARPAQCVVLEDSFAGIRAAHAAGMIPIMVPDRIQPDSTIRQLVYHVAADLVEARTVIAHLVRQER